MPNFILRTGLTSLRAGFYSAVLLSMAILSQNAGAATIFFGENPDSNGVLGGVPETARDAFLNNLIGVGTEDFESFTGRDESAGVPSGQMLPLALTFPGSTGNITATLSEDTTLAGAIGAGGEIFGRPGDGAAGRFATSGVKYLNNITTQFTIDFDTEIAAFGFYGTDFGDFDGRVTVTTGTQAGPFETFAIDSTVSAPNNALLFWGIIDADNPFTTVTFDIINNPNNDPFAPPDFFGFDDLTIGDIDQVVVPIPGALLLFGTGLGFMGLLGGWRRKK